MPITKLRLAHAHVKDPGCEPLKELLLESLSSQERTVYEYVTSHAPTTTRKMAERMQVSISNVGNILLRLYKFGLIERRPSRDESGLLYVWSK